MTPERFDHMTTQYIWALENEQVFMVKAQYEAERSNFGQFRRLVGTYIMPTRKLLGEDQAHALSGPEWSFLYLDMWVRIRNCIGYSRFPAMTAADDKDFAWQLDRLNNAGYKLTSHGVVPCGAAKNMNPCAEISLGDLQPCTLQEPEKEETMSIIKITHVTYINGTPIDQVKDDQLIEHIKKAEADIADLKSIKTKSEKIKAKIEELNASLAEVVAILDARV